MNDFKNEFSLAREKNMRDLFNHVLKPESY